MIHSWLRRKLWSFFDTSDPVSFMTLSEYWYHSQQHTCCNKTVHQVIINVAYSVLHSVNKWEMYEIHFGFVHQVDPLCISILAKLRGHCFTLPCRRSFNLWHRRSVMRNHPVLFHFDWMISFNCLSSFTRRCISGRDAQILIFRSGSHRNLQSQPQLTFTVKSLLILLSIYIAVYYSSH
jgi:hypothetical protein